MTHTEDDDVHEGEEDAPRRGEERVNGRTILI